MFTIPIGVFGTLIGLTNPIHSFLNSIFFKGMVSKDGSVCMKMIICVRMALHV